MKMMKFQNVENRNKDGTSSRYRILELHPDIWKLMETDGKWNESGKRRSQQLVPLVPPARLPEGRPP
jgi:hypothetical protein